jgi:hypothetical protein
VDWWCKAGGILTVLELIENHKAAFVYDFRHRFGVGLDDIGTTLPWGEVLLLLNVLLRDPSSWLQTSVSKWHHPVTYEWATTAATYDLLAQVHSKRKPKPYPRPWMTGANNKGRKGTLRKDAREILAKARNGELKWQNRHMRM